jgi:hypothetical protein
MNRYLLKVPYSYLKYGILSFNVFAESESDAEDLAGEFESHFHEDYDDGENDGDMDFDYYETQVELEESDVNSPDAVNNKTESPVPDYYLSEINLI